MDCTDTPQTTDLVSDLRKAVDSKVGSQVKNCCVEICRGRVTVRGNSPTYYVKQLATHALLPIIGDRELDNLIIVDPPRVRDPAN